MKQAMATADVNAWLAAMPISDVKARIAEVERELRLLRLLEPTTLHRTPPLRTRRLSPQRKAILRLVRDDPGLVPAEIARELGVEPNAIQTNMSRMVAAGQLVRVAHGRYRVPAHVSADL